MRLCLETICLVAAALAISSAPTLAAESQCLGWSDPVTLTGFPVEGLFPGPPEFTSVQSGDAVYTAQFIYLSEPVCVVADPSMDTAPLAGVELVQLACPDVSIVPGQVNSVTGTLFAPHTGYHRARILIACD